jgi:hypothetical protein
MRVAAVAHHEAVWWLVPNTCFRANGLREAVGMCKPDPPDFTQYPDKALPGT